MMVDQRIEKFRAASNEYLEKYGKDQNCIIWDIFPDEILSDVPKVTLEGITLIWKDNYDISIDAYHDPATNGSRFFDVYTESCEARFEVVANAPDKGRGLHKMNLHFRIVSYDTQVTPFLAYVFSDVSKLYDGYHTHLIRNQFHFFLDSIDESRFGGASRWEGDLGFCYYTDYVRKSRQTQPANASIGDKSFFDQLSYAHKEVGFCIKNMLGTLPLISDLTQREIIHEGQSYFPPNINFYGEQYNMFCSFGIERLYSYWETLLVLLYNYYDAGLKNMRSQSFNNYFQKISKNISTTPFKLGSLNLEWFLNFSQSDHKKISEFRNRNVHHQFTPEYAGLFSAKMSINVHKNVNDRAKLEQLNTEMKAMSQFLIDQFNLCKVGFEKALHLIDELP